MSSVLLHSFPDIVPLVEAPKIWRITSMKQSFLHVGHLSWLFFWILFSIFQSVNKNLWLRFSFTGSIGWFPATLFCIFKLVFQQWFITLLVFSFLRRTLNSISNCILRIYSIPYLIYMTRFPIMHESHHLVVVQKSFSMCQLYRLMKATYGIVRSFLWNAWILYYCCNIDYWR